VTAEPTAANTNGDAPESDERVRGRNWFQQALSKPSSGAIIAALVAFVVFSWPLWECVADVSECYGKGFLSARGIANWLEVSAQVGILAAAVTLLMIAGEFDLSIGSMIGAAGMFIAIGMDVYGLPPFLAVAFAFAFALSVGFFNGWLVTKTGLPSFIVTLGMLFLLRGLTIGMTRYITSRTQVGGLSQYTEGDFFSSLFTGEVRVPLLDIEIEASVVWWVVLTVVAAWVLFKTTFGNWIFGTGGNKVSARNVGVPVRRVKISLFMCTAAAAALLATIQVLEFSSADTARGNLKELEAIASAVIGGNLLTGGYGSPIGTFFGALTLGMTQVGIPMAGLPGDWFRAVLGVVLLVAVLGSNWIRMRGTGVRS
jgi:simple sugar transport system permease protein